MDSFLSHPLGAILVFTIVVGVVSTLILDLYALVLEKAVGIPQSNWGAVGHWLLGMTRGNSFFHPLPAASTHRANTVSAGCSTMS